MCFWKCIRILKISIVCLYVLEGFAWFGQRATAWSVGVDGRSLNFWQLAEGQFWTISYDCWQTDEIPYCCWSILDMFVWLRPYGLQGFWIIGRKATMWSVIGIAGDGISLEIAAAGAPKSRLSLCNLVCFLKFIWILNCLVMAEGHVPLKVHKNFENQ